VESRPYDIFLNYPGGSYEDSQNVLRLGQALSRAGLRPWISEQEHPTLNDEAKAAIKEVLDVVPIFIACVGTRQLRSWGHEEVSLAATRAPHDNAFLICTVLLPGAKSTDVTYLPVDFHRQVFDLRKGLGDAEPLVSLCQRWLRPPEDELLARIGQACRESPGVVLLTGPVGTGKSVLARRAMERLSEDFPEQAVVSVAPGASAAEALEEMGGALFGERLSADQVRSRVGRGRYLLVFDEVLLPDATELIVPGRSATIVVGQVAPAIRVDHVSIRLPMLPWDSRIGAAGEESPQIQPGYASDVPGGPDLLAIQKPVQALCSVIAAKDVEPPLSIGLFAEWGAGKTFFVEQMRGRVGELARASAQAEASSYCSSIKQIVFNAWHYADANLWASLAGRVFEGLAEEEGGESRRLYQELESSRVQLREAESEEQQARERAKRAGQEKKRAQAEIEQARIELTDLAAAADDALADDLLTMRGVLAQLWRRAKGRLVLLGLLLCVLVGLVVAYPEAPALILALLPTVALATQLIAGPVKFVTSTQEEARRRVEVQRRERNAKLEAQLERSREEEGEARRRHEDARRQLEGAEREIEEIKNGNRLFEFITERSGETAYGDYLGLIALVRRDFERLSRLMAEHTGKGEASRPRIERIVLYIDDLDRCPSARVVEVLEAVHLLMASELFVVVVAVDPRWLLSSLRRHYEREMADGAEGLWAPTPQDYLEKIFQIPFSLPEMKEDGFRRLIEHLIPPPADEEEPLGGGPEEAAGPASDLPDPAAGGGPGARPSPSSDGDDPASAGLDLEPEGLQITATEIEFMSGLRSLVRTPRAAKRLTNLYRLVRAGLSEPEIDTLLGRSGLPPHFPCLQLLLAIVVGFPSLAPRLLGDIAQADPGTWWDFVESWKPPDDEDEEAWQRLVAAMEPLRREWLPGMELFARWVPQVARYSYSGLPADAAGD
jgi:KAP family P-loop domain